MMLKTPLNRLHHQLDAHMVEYAGWEMPLRYRSEIEEHHAVRRDAGMFDVSHMSRLDILGSGTRDFLRWLLANDVGKLKHPGSALYSCMLNDDAGILDDLIVYYLDDHHFRLVANAATREKDLAWIQRQARGFNVEIRVRDDLAMIAVQGPHARARTNPLLPRGLGNRIEGLKPFAFAWTKDWLVARTGYTGEDGYEVMVPNDTAPQLWQNLLQARVEPCGLAARDTLRLEAGLNLYGQDMDASVSPLECGLEWTVALDPLTRRFIGRQALEKRKAGGIKLHRAGLILLEPGVLRQQQKVKLACGAGVVTSGGYSPTLQRSIGLARLPVGDDVECLVEIRGRWKRAQLVHPPFVRHGKITFESLTDKGETHE